VTTIGGDYTIYRPPPDTTLCDGYPRITGRATPTGSAPTSVVTIDTTWVSTQVSVAHPLQGESQLIDSVDVTKSNMHS
jgi:hypothetical protein